MWRFLYSLSVCALQHPLWLASICLLIGYVQVTEIDVRKKLMELYRRVRQRIAAYRKCKRYAYDMSTGPHTWQCDPLYQSPINIEDNRIQKLIIRELLNWNHYDDLPLSVTLENTGHVLVVRATYNGNRPTLSGADLLACYTFVEMRFHWGWCNSEGSEHTVNNKKYPMELQVMHRTGPYDNTCTSSYDLLMIAYFFELSTHNPYLDPITQNLKLVKKAGSKATISPFPLSYLTFPFRTSFYSYGGSLTEPPCYQGTEWFIFPESLAINEYQLRQFRELCQHDGVMPILRNTRPVQDLGTRVVSLNQFFPFDHCPMMPDTEEDCEEETTINTTTIITSNVALIGKKSNNNIGGSGSGSGGGVGGGAGGNNIHANASECKLNMTTNNSRNDNNNTNNEDNISNNMECNHCNCNNSNDSSNNNSNKSNNSSCCDVMNMLDEQEHENDNNSNNNNNNSNNSNMNNNLKRQAIIT